MKPRQAGRAGRALQVAVTGASGMVGASLCTHLSRAGHHVLRVGRSRSTSDVVWDPQQGVLDATALEGLDSVVHLAGESVFGLRWTAGKKKRILQSRIIGTQLLSETLSRLESPPEVLISASAVGYYGDRGDESVGESAEPGSGFLADVCKVWEQEAEVASSAGMRVG